MGYEKGHFFKMAFFGKGLPKRRQFCNVGRGGNPFCFL
jgi:hypothetical protein